MSCWGHNESGQLGDGTTTERLSPAPVTASQSFTEVSAGGKHSCGAIVTGETYCWGSNEYGQLGDGSTTDRPVPTPVVFRLCCQTSTGSKERMLSFAPAALDQVTPVALLIIYSSSPGERLRHSRFKPSISVARNLPSKPSVLTSKAGMSFFSAVLE